MIIVSSKEFREHQKKYFELADKNEQIIVQRSKKRAYAMVPITETDRYFANPSVIEQLNQSIEQAEKGYIAVTLSSKDDINSYLGL